MDVINEFLREYGLGMVGYALAFVFILRNFRISDRHQKFMHDINEKFADVVVSNTRAMEILTAQIKATRTLPK